MIIFFDIDDTLIDHSRAMRAAAIELHSELGMVVQVDEFVTRWQEAHRRHYPRYLAGELSYEAVRRIRIREAISPDLGDDEADELFSQYMRNYQSQWTLFPDVLPCLDRLQGFVLGVISNGPSAERRAKLRAFGIEHRFQHILISEECGVAKPASQIFQLACQMGATSPNEAAHVGDHFEIDVCGSRNAGLRAIWLNRISSVHGNGDEVVITSLNQLPEALGLSTM